MVRALRSRLNAKQRSGTNCGSECEQDRPDRIWRRNCFCRSSRRTAGHAVLLQPGFWRVVSTARIRNHRAGWARIVRGSGGRIVDSGARGNLRHSDTAGKLSAGYRVFASGRRFDRASGRNRRIVGQEAPVGVKEGGNVGGSSVSRFVSVVVPLLLLVALAAVPFVRPGPNIIRLLFVTLTLVTASVGWNLIGGFAGQISFGFAVFYGLGAYTTALALNGGIPPVIAFSLGAVVAAVASLLIGLPTFRFKGPYFAIATIGVSEAVRVVMMNVPFTGGASGYRIIDKARFVQSHHYYTALVLAVLAVVISILVRRSKLGLALIAI